MRSVPAAYLHRLRMAGGAAADLVVRGVLVLAAGVAHAGLHHARHALVGCSRGAERPRGAGGAQMRTRPDSLYGEWQASILPMHFHQRGSWVAVAELWQQAAAQARRGGHAAPVAHQAPGPRSTPRPRWRSPGPQGPWRAPARSPSWGRGPPAGSAGWVVRACGGERVVGTELVEHVGCQARQAVLQGRRLR